MGLIQTVSVHATFATLLTLTTKRGRYILIEDKLVELDELSTHINPKATLYLSIEQDDEIDEKVFLSNLIKNPKVIRTTLAHKLSEKHTNSELLFNYHPIGINEHDETIEYQIDATVLHSYQKSLELVKHFSHIKRASTFKFSLLALCNATIDEKSYICVYTQANTIMLLAITDREILFSRTTTIVVENMEDRQRSMVDDINRTIAYVNQQYRDVRFSTIAVSGSLSLDDDTMMHLFMLSRIPICILYPNTLISGLQNEMSHHYILSIGALYIDKSHQYIPPFIKGERTYSFGVEIVFLLSSVIFFITTYFALEAYENFNATLDEYDSIKTRLVRTVKNTDTYSYSNLERSYNLLQIGQKHLKNDPRDILIALEPLINLQKPSAFSWETKEKAPNFTLKFSKSFSTLQELYQFEKEFLTLYSDANKSIPLSYQPRHNYKTLTFETTIASLVKKKTPPPRRRRRRH